MDKKGKYICQNCHTKLSENYINGRYLTCPVCKHITEIELEDMDTSSIEPETDSSEEDIVAVCSCGIKISSKYQKGNWVKCPGCKTVFQVRLKHARELGKCPSGCGEMLIETDYNKQGLLVCPHCRNKAVFRPEIGVPQAFAGFCYECHTPLVLDNQISDKGVYKCPTCSNELTSRYIDDDFRTYPIAGYCPICGETLCKGDIEEYGYVKCRNCGISIHCNDEGEIKTGDFYLLPKIDINQFRVQCYQLLYKHSPVDVFDNLTEKELKLTYYPFLYTEGTLLPLFEDEEKFTAIYDGSLPNGKHLDFEIADKKMEAEERGSTFDLNNYLSEQRKLAVDMGESPCISDKEFKYASIAYTTEVVKPTLQLQQQGVVIYVGKWQMDYNYKKDSLNRTFSLWANSNQFWRIPSCINIPLEPLLYGKRKHQLVLKIVTALSVIIWWWSSDGFFNALWKFVVLLIVFFIIWGPVNEGLSNRIWNKLHDKKKEKRLSSKKYFKRNQIKVWMNY